MKLKLHNILKVADADIELGGLTVITGENDSGKSTVGKVLFSTLKAANNVRQVDRVNTLSILRTQLASVKRLFSRYGHDLPSLENTGLRDAAGELVSDKAEHHRIILFHDDTTDADGSDIVSSGRYGGKDLEHSG